MTDLFVVGLSWRTAEVAVREKLAFREEELIPTLKTLTARLPVTEALLISTCNRVEVYGVGAATEITRSVRELLAELRGIKLADVAPALYEHRGPAAIRHVFSVASSLDSLVVGEAQILGQLKDAYKLAEGAGTSGSVLSRCLERAFGVAKRVRTETAIARGAANVSTVAVELAARVFGDLAGKNVLVVGAGKMSSLAARHLYGKGAQKIVVTNRSPQKAAALADEVEGEARPWEELERLLVEADVVLSSTGAAQPILTKSLFKRVAKARRWRSMMVIDIAVPRDAEPAIIDLDGIYLFNIDDLDRVLKENQAERARAAEHAAKIVEHEAGQFEHWLRTQGVVPTIVALRERFAQIADAEVQKVVEHIARKELSREQQKEAVTQLVRLVINKLLHHPTSVLRAADPDEAGVLAAAVCELFGLSPSAVGDDDGEVAETAEPVLSSRKAQ